MPFDSLSITSGEIKAFALEQGVDIVGITSVENMLKLRPKRDPGIVLPKAKAIVTFGIRMLTGAWASPSERVKTFHGYMMYLELTRLAYRIGRFIEQRGYSASIPPVHRPIEQSAETKGYIPELSFKHAAVAIWTSKQELR